MLDTVVGFGQIIIADLILSGDNALVIGMAAAGLPTEQRKKAIFYGMVIAAVLRIVFALIATYLLGVKGLTLFWVSTSILGLLVFIQRNKGWESFRWCYFK